MSISLVMPPVPAPEARPEPTTEVMSLEDALDQVRYLIMSNRLDEASAGLDKILAHAPDHPPAWTAVGMMQLARKQHDAAIGAFRRVTELNPQRADAWLNLGNALIRGRRLAESVEVLRRVVALEPNSAHAFNSFGVVCMRVADRVRAEEAFREALRLDPDNVQAHFNYAQLLEDLNRPSEAAGHALRTIELEPGNPKAQELRFRSHALLGEYDKAFEALEELARLQPDNPEIEHYRNSLLAESGQATPLRASDDYVEHHFDNFAANFDERLGALEYRAPTLVVEALEQVRGELPEAPSALDAGCGTGLCAPLLGPFVNRLVGVDLSDGMLKRARERGGYAALHQGELTAFLEHTDEAYDLVISADTLCYFGDLSGFLAATHRALQGPGLVIFSLEAMNDDARDYELKFHGRYRHSRRYVADVLEQAGFAVRSIEPRVLRKEFNEPVHGWIVTASRR